MSERFFDKDGNEVSLDKLVRLEPDWAASRIRYYMDAQPAVTDEQMEAHVYEIACRAAFVAKEQSDPYLVAGQVVEEFKARAIQDKANHEQK